MTGARGRHSAALAQRDEGMTLVEVIVAMFLVGIILMALAATLLSSLRAININETEVRASSIAQQELELLQTLEWDAAVLYEDEIGAAPREWSDALDAPGVFDGRELVTRPAPASPSARLAPVPVPVSTIEQAGVVYSVYRYVTWIDRNEDGTPDTKRFDVRVAWEGRNSQRALSASAERTPTQGEAASTDLGTRILQFTVSPDPADLDSVTGFNVSSVRFHVRLNTGSTGGTLRYYVLVENPGWNEGDPFESRFRWELVTAAMSGSSPHPSGGHSAWSYTMPTSAHRFVNGPMDVQFLAHDPGLNRLESYAGLTWRYGPWEGVPPRPASGSGDDSGPFPDPPRPDPDPAPPSPDRSTVSITNVSLPNPLCVDRATWHPRSTYTITTHTTGLTSADGNVTLTYQYRTRTNPGKGSIQTASAGASYVSGGEAGAQYRLDITPSSGQRFMPGDSVTFTIDARRASDGQNTSTTRTVQVSSSC